MKILLIQPPNFNKLFCESPNRLQGQVGFYPPLGLMYIASYLRKFSHHDVAILDTLIEKMDYEDISEQIRIHNPDAVGISVTSFTLIDAYKTAQIVKETKPDTRVIMGGPHINLYPRETLGLPAVDIVVRGEGEITMKELLDQMQEESSLTKIEGIGYKINGKLYFTKNREFIKDLDILPFPARDITPFKKYYSIFGTDRTSTILMTSRGCPYSCAFCFRESGSYFRARSAKNVVDEIEQCCRMSISEFFIFDETFTINKKRVQDICDEIIRRDLQIQFDMRTRVDIVCEELLTKLKKAGCKRIQYGVESGSQKILNLMKKGITIEQIYETFRLTKKIGIDTYADFMLGYPTETKEDMYKTISFAMELNPDFVQFAITTLYPGTELYQTAFKKQILDSDFWKEFSAAPFTRIDPPLWTEYYTRGELIDILEMAYSRFYIRPGYILRRLAKIKTPDEFLRHAKMGIKLILRK
jgi:radical SAM superfamily enzyme YgiQ (UPF0313 family)